VTKEQFSRLTMRDVTLFIDRINARLSLEIRAQAVLHGIKLDSETETEDTTEETAATLSEKQKSAIDKHLADAQERIMKEKKFG
jgi:hypothetical protein